MNEKLNPLHIGILIHMTQMGVSVFSLPRVCATYIGTNGWVWVLVIGTVVTANIALMHAAVRLGGGRTLPEMLGLFLPKPVAGALQLALGGMYALSACLTSKQYVLMFELQSFPATNPYVFRAGIDVLILCLVLIGIYNLGKAATLVFLATIPLPMFYLSLLHDVKLVRYTPFFLKDGGNWLEGSFEVFSAFLGFELCLFLLPYVKRGDTRWFYGVYAGNTFSWCMYLALTILAFGFFSFGQLKDLLFPLLEMAGHLTLPIVERVDTLLFTFFFLVSVLTATAYFWMATELFGYVFPGVRKGWFAAFLIGSTYFVSSIPNELGRVSAWLGIMAKLAAGTAIFLPLLLIAGLLAARAWRAKAP